RLLLTATACMFVFICLCVIGLGDVADAFSRFFGFAPGYGIIENNQSSIENNQNIEYVIDGQDLAVEDKAIIMNLRTATATKDSIGIYIEVKRKNISEAEMIKEKKQQVSQGTQNKTSIVLTAGDKIYNEYSGITADGGDHELAYVSFSVNPSDINTHLIYTIHYADYKATLKFKLKKIDSFNTLEEIGSTDTHNNISVTAVTTKKDDRLQVHLYPVNKSDYKITSFVKEFDTGYDGKDFQLKTNKGLKTYLERGSWIGAAFNIDFSISKDEKPLFLNIPFIIATTNESSTVKIKIPAFGQKITLNKEVRFKDATMIITDVEKIRDKVSSNELLKMNLAYKNFEKNKIMFNARFGRVKGNWSFESKSDGDHVSSINFSLEKGDGDSLNLIINNPEYYLLGDYKLEIKGN
ncbi:MAG: hypothetical protein Q8942_12575, partial [Bacillota bacterium]|nr:hypothetical protein [Bacillota bacterium]